MIKLFSTGCPKCKVLMKKLKASGKEFEVIEDLAEVNKYAEEHDIHSAPFILTDEGEILEFVAANKLLS